jgi:glycosyltransferase involved in cell wall biosynthesis
LERRRLRPVFLIHDLIPITHPQYCRLGEEGRHRQRIENALRAGQAIIANSTATKHELARFARDCGLPMPLTTVAWLGIDQSKPSAVRLGQPDERPYFMLVGTIEGRKNHLMILQAWEELIARLGDKAPQLLIVGQRGWEAEEATDILDNPGILKGHVRELSRCDDETMSALLAGARAMLMPSFVEGFGLPLVEALQQGVPVIASNLQVFREISGEVPTYLDPNDRQAWLKAVLDYSTDGRERRRQLKAATEFRAPSWNDHFTLVEGFLETL